MKNADQSAINGTMSISDYDSLTGGLLSARLDPFTRADEGSLTNNGGANGTTVSNYTPPRWLAVRNVAGTSKTAAQSTAPLINGQPAAGPAQAGQPATGNRRK